jgi:hypothetical protein
VKYCYSCMWLVFWQLDFLPGFVFALEGSAVSGENNSCEILLRRKDEKGVVEMRCGGDTGRGRLGYGHSMDDVRKF